MAVVVAIAPVGLVHCRRPIEVLIDRLRRLALQDRDNCLPAQPPVTLAPL